MSLTLTPSRSQDTIMMESSASHVLSDVEPTMGQDCSRQYERPPPLHTGADWKIILHLPEIDTWIRSTSERVRGLTQSVQEDPQNKHVDVHLMQLKEICEDISDHVEQIHALLDTEFSLKLLSYSVNVIVDIHTVQLLWHQLRVSVLVLRERILQGLQDSNGNYTRQTDILQAFTNESQEDRLDALTEVDGSGQLTIRCPTDYLSLDCGITAYELSDYSPREEETHTPTAKPLQAWTFSAMQQEFPDLVKGTGLLSVASENKTEELTTEQENDPSLPPTELAGQSQFRALPSNESTTPKRPLQESSDHGGDSPTRPSLPKRGLFLSDSDNWGQADLTETSVDFSSPHLSLPPCPSSPRNHLTLALTPPYSLATTMSPKSQLQSNYCSEEKDLGSPIPQYLNDMESPSRTNPSHCNSPKNSQTEEHTLLDSSPKEIGASNWYGSDEFLALPSHLHQTDILALHLGSLSQLVSSPTEDPQSPLRDVEDWEISSESEIGPSSSRCLSPSIPSELASCPSGSGQSTPHIVGAVGSERQERAAVIQRLLWDIQRQDNDRHVWDRIQKLRVKVMDWPSMSPDLNPIKRLCGFLKRKVWECKVSNIHQLRDVVMEELKRTVKLCFQEAPPMSVANGTPTFLEAQRDAVSQMSLQLSSEQYSKDPPHSHLAPIECSQTSESLQEVEADCQESLDWLLDMEATVQNNLGLLVSEDQHLQMCKRCSVEMSMREDKMLSLLSRFDALKCEGPLLPGSILDKQELIREKWQMLKRSLSEALSDSVHQPVLSPGSGSLVQQLDQRVKELKSWLRDTELTLYNSSLRIGDENDRKSWEGLQRELDRFQSLCSELRLRRRGVASVLRLCHHLQSLQEHSMQQDPPTMQLLSVNLERRWEAIVMQSTQWQRRLQRELGEEQEMDVLVDPDWADLNGAGGEEALEWDETDIAAERVCHSPEPKDMASCSPAQDTSHCLDQDTSSLQNPKGSHHAPVYQIYSLHNMELFRSDMDPALGKSSALASLSLSLIQGCSFKSLPNLAGGSDQNPSFHPQKKHTISSGHSESESGIASGGEGVTAANSEGCLSLEGEGLLGSHEQVGGMEPVSSIDADAAQYARTKIHGPLILNDYSLLQSDRLVLGKGSRAVSNLCLSNMAAKTGTNRTILPASSLDHSPEDFQDLIEVLSTQDSSPSTSSLESLSVNCEVLETSGLRRSVSLESWPASYKSNEDLFSQHGSADITPGSEAGEELSKRTLDLLKRLEDIECPSEQKMKRSLSDDITLRSSIHEVPLTGLRISPDRGSSRNEYLGSELTELSSSEELSLKSEDMAVLKGRLLDTNASFRKHLSRSLGGEEGEANLSMIVNVSCTSACTDEEDDSDLLSSSTLTLTEEEEEEEEEEELDEPNFSLGSEDETGDGIQLPLGSDFIRRELQAWIRPSFLLPRERRKLGRTAQNIKGMQGAEKMWHSSLSQEQENNGNRKDSDNNLKREGEKKTLNYPRQLVDDMENGNVYNRPETMNDMVNKTSRLERDMKPGPQPWMSITKTERLHPPCMPALAYHKPREPGSSSNGKSNLRVTCDASKDVDMSDSNCSVQEKKQSVPSTQVLEESPESSCSCHGSAHDKPNNSECNAHEFVKEILDITTTALHGSPPQDTHNQGTGAQIKEKVLEYSRKQLERGDFYSYLSISSHDSDCGELNGSVRVTTPVQMVEDEDTNMETIFEACTEEDNKSKQKGIQSTDSKHFSIVTSSQSRTKTEPIKTTKKPYVKTTSSGQQKSSTGKFQVHSEANYKGDSTKISSRILSSPRDLCSESKGKSTTKATTSSLPILHKRTREQRPMALGNTSTNSGKQKKPLHGAKTQRDL
ncbi:A-kinase anchor protein 6 [Bombina bombina]|uniref:A-kinase anchor protein 6 n=1 Tax=Bombina bombina TaxID=8345 RepID=UPI00235A7EBA|nr:A-kinase anchor protein 6 [Bombina bombina]